MLGGGAAYELGSMALGPLAALRGIRAIPGLARRAIGGAAFGAATQPKEPLLGGVLGGLLSPAADLATAAVAPLQATKGLLRYLNPKRSAEAVEAIQKALPPGVSLPAGTLMQSSPLMNIENIVEKIPGAGMKRSAQELHLNIKNTLNDFMNRLHGKNEPDLNKSVFDEMHQGYQDAESRYDQALKEFFDNARGNPEAQALTNPAGLQIPDTRLIHSVYTKRSAPIFKRIAGMKSPPEDMKALQDALNDYHPDKIQPSLTNLQDFEREKRMINLKRREEWGKKHYITAKFLGDLRRTLMRDLGSSAENVAPGLANKLRESDAIYRNEVIPYKKVGTKNTPFWNVIKEAESKGSEPNTDKFIQKYFKPGADVDQANLMNELITRSANPEKTRNLLLNYHFRPTREAEEINPSKFMGKYKKLGEMQKQSLFGHLKPDLDNFSNLKAAYGEIFNPDFMPKTGFQMAKLAIPLAESSGLIGGGLAGHFPAALAALAGTTIGARGLGKLLQSDILPSLMQRAAKAGAMPLTAKLIRPSLMALLSSPQIGGKQ
jgi:hypothetical protein